MTPRPAGRLRRFDAAVTRAADLLLELAVVAMAAWTLGYDTALSTTHSATLALLVAALLMLPGGWLLWLLHRGRVAGVEADDRLAAPVRRGPAVVVLRVVCVAAAAGAAVAVSLPGSMPRWSLVWAPAMAAAVGGLLAAGWAVRAQPRSSGESRDLPRAVAVGGLVVVCAALGLATLSLFVSRPDADDVFYVNRAQYVAEHGRVPVRDTMFGDQTYPALEKPALPSYEALAGEAARIVHKPAADVVYYVVPPLVTFLATLALWRLLRSWRARWPMAALAVALLFLVMGGAEHTSFGNFFLARMWQGKVLFLAAVVPLLFALLTEWSAARRHAQLALLVLTGVAAVGLSTTATLIVPLVAVAGLLPLAVRAPRVALLGFAATILYPFAAGVATRLDRGGGGDAAAGGATVTSDPAQTFANVLGHDALAGVALFAVLVGWLCLRSRHGRASAATAAVLGLGALAPGALHIAGHYLGSSYDLWRLLWVLPAAALVGALATSLASVARPAAALMSAGIVAVVIVFGVPLWATSNHASLVSRPVWKLDPVALAEARSIAAHAQAGDIVLAPVDASGSLAILTTRMWAVDPRDMYVGSGFGDDFHEVERLTLQRFTAGDFSPPEVGSELYALRVLHVGYACVEAQAQRSMQVLRDAGWTPSAPAGTLQCFARG